MKKYLVTDVSGRSLIVFDKNTSLSKLQACRFFRINPKSKKWGVGTMKSEIFKA